MQGGEITHKKRALRVISKKPAEGPMLWRTEESADDLVCQ